MDGLGDSRKRGPASRAFEPQFNGAPSNGLWLAFPNSRQPGSRGVYVWYPATPPGASRRGRNNARPQSAHNRKSAL